jgi:pimeloyl-ACP methyl ester carboxylesterase
VTALRAAEVRGRDGVRLHVREAGPPEAAPIVFIHGWSQSWLSWRHQLQSALADRWRLVAYDLRGHGMSDRPSADDAYSVAQRWADDLDSLIEQRELARPILVGWSFGGYVTCDYIRAYGTGALAGANLVSWAVMIGDSPKQRALTGSGFNDHFEAACSPDLATSIAAMIAFVDECSAVPLAREDRDTILAFNMLVPPHVRRAMSQRGTLDNTELLSGLTVPVLVSQGDRDTITSRAAAAHIGRHCPTARESIYAGVGHMPFLEDRERFNRELGEFAHAVHGVR